MKIDLSIVIPCFNNLNFTKNALDDLMQLPNNYEIIIVDNGSTDGTGEYLNEILSKPKNPEQAELVYIGCPKNLGFGRANNKGYKHSRGENVLFLNNDIRVKSDFKTWPEKIIEECNRGKMVSANGGLLTNKFQFITETEIMHNSDYFYLSGWCLASSKKIFDSLILNYYRHDQTDEITQGRAWGPWNEMFINYFEDNDLTWRAKDLRITLDVISVPVHHFGRMTSKKLGLAEMYKKSQATFVELWAHKLGK